jgi:hypothetical protein
MISENFVFLAAALNLIGSLGYVRDTLWGHTKPNRVTWFLWALAPLIAFGAMIDEEVGVQSLMTFMVGFGPLLVFVASFVNRKSVWRLGRFDYICGALSLIGLLLWLITGEGVIAIAFAILADGLAAAPTVRKSYIAPETESGLVFLLSAISAGVTLLTIDEWNFATYGFPVYILLVCVLLFSLIHFRLGKRIKEQRILN